MTIEIYWLVLSILLTAILWVPIIINRLLEHGIVHGIMDPDGITDSNVGWANRMMAAHVNAVENLVVFAPLVIILYLLDMSTELTVAASALYFYSRLAHAVLFTFRIPILRIVAFLGGFAAEMIFVFTLLGLCLATL